MSDQNVIINLKGESTGLRQAARSGQLALGNLNQSIKALSESNIRFNASANRLTDSQGRFVGVVQQARAVAAQLNAEKQRSLKINELLEKSLKKEELAILRSTGALNSFRGATGSADFALLSFTQGIQDAGQFGVGMAQGIRAVNNNLQQFVTSLVFSAQQSGGFVNALGSIGKAMIGPAGILLAFSAVSAGIEFFSNRTQGAKKEVNDLKRAFDEVSGSLIEFEDRVSGRTFRIPDEALPGVIESLKKEVEAFDEAAKLAEKSLSAGGGTFSIAINQRVREENEAILAAREKIANISESDIEAQKSILRELEAQQAKIERIALIRKELERQGFVLAESDSRSRAELSESEKIMVRISNLRSFLFSQEESAVGVLSVQAEMLERLRDARQEQVRLEELLRILRDEPQNLQALLSEIKLSKDLNEITKERIRFQLEQLELQGVLTEFEREEILEDLDLGDKLETEADKVDRQMERLNAAFGRGIASGVEGFIGGIADLATGLEKNPANALLAPFADMAINLGRIAVATGIGIQGIKSAFKSLNPAAAIGAGVALIALGKVIKSRIAATGASIGAGTSSASAPSAAPGASGFSGFDTGQRFSTANAALAPSPGFASPVSIGGRFIAEGRELVAVVNNEVAAQRRSGVRNPLVVQ